MMRLAAALVTAALLPSVPLCTADAEAAPAAVSPAPRPTPTPTSPRVFTSTGQYLRVDDRQADGSLVEAPGSPYLLDIRGNATDLAVSPRGYVFASLTVPGSVAAFRIGPDGRLSAVPGSPFPAGNIAGGIAVSPDGSRLFVTGDDEVSVFAVADDGSLNPVAGSPFNAPEIPRDLAVSPAGNRLYVASYSELTAYSVAADGALTTDGEPVFPPVSATRLAVTPDGARVYAYGDNSSTIYGYDVSETGPPSALPPTRVIDGELPPEGLFPDGLAISPDGTDLYVTALASGASILRFGIGADGALTALGSTDASPYPLQLAVAPGGAFVYASSQDRAIAYSRGVGGSLTRLTSAVPPGDPSMMYRGLAVSPDLAPTAAIAPGAGSVGLPVQLDGSGSTDPDGTVARYDWDFGDGATASDGGPTPRHTYSAPGSYQVTLTVTDDLGCSTKVVYTGHTPSCALTTGARTTRVVHVDAAHGPTIVAHASSRTGINPAGWSRSPVTITWSCTAAPGTTLVTACPPATVERTQVRGKSVTGTVTDSRGRTATATVLVRIDRRPPVATIRGVRNGRTYSEVQRVTCRARDRLVGRVRCRVRTHEHQHGESSTVRYKAVAQDPAGNRTVRRGRYFVS